MKTTGPKKGTGKVTFLGWADDTDPIYKGGWNLLGKSNLNPQLAQPSSENSADQEDKDEK